MALRFNREYYEKVRKELPNQIYEELKNGKVFYFKEIP